jgi:hypothetical protein
MESSLTCPKCAFSSGGTEFTVCPKCGIIIKKYFETQQKRQRLEEERRQKRELTREEEAVIEKDREERERLIQQEEERQRQERTQEEERESQVRSWSKLREGAARFLSAVVMGFLGAAFILGGLLTEPGESGTVTLHRLHIKQTLYQLGGVCLIVSAVNFGFARLLAALADIHKAIKEQSRWNNHGRS